MRGSIQDKKAFQMEKSNKSFSIAGRLKEFERINSARENPFQCTKFDKRFFKIKFLKEH